MGAPQPATPAAYLATLPAARRADVKALHTAIRRAAPRLKPYVAYHGTMIGYGPYHYRYASGREGDCPTIALSSRAQYISLYVLGQRGGQSLVQSARKQLGQVACGRSCIRIKRLADLSLPAAMALVREAAQLLDNGSTDFSL